MDKHVTGREINRKTKIIGKLRKSVIFWKLTSDSCSVSVKEARMGRTSTDSRSWDGEGTVLLTVGLAMVKEQFS
jgi:hypothetical protein